MLYVRITILLNITIITYFVKTCCLSGFVCVLYFNDYTRVINWLKKHWTFRQVKNINNNLKLPSRYLTKKKKNENLYECMFM